MRLAPIHFLDSLLQPLRSAETAPIRWLDAGRTTPGNLVFERVHGRGDPRFDELCALVCRDSQYWRQTQHDQMTPSSAASLLAALPMPTRPDHKYLWSLYRDDALVGCLDVVRNWPAKHTLSLGFLMIDARFRGQGIGRAALTHLRERTRSWAEIQRWRVAVVQTQADALRFWNAARFVETGEARQAPGQLAPLIVLERRIGR